MIEQITTDPTKVRAGQDFQIKVKVTQYNTTTDEGEDLSITNTKQNGKMKFDLYGNTTQTVIEADDGSTVEGTGTVTANDVENEKVHYLTPKGDTKQAILPSEYQQVEYIESTGSQYIDTRYKLTSNNLQINTKIYTANMPSVEQDIVSNQDNTNGRFILGLYSKRVFLYNKNENVSYNNAYSSVFDGSQTLEIQANISGTTKKINVNGTDFAITINNYNIYSSNSNIILFSDTNNANKFIGKLYYLKLYDNNILVRDYIPCYRKSDSAVGLYDIVNGSFYTYGGENPFLKGSDIPNPNYSQEIKNVKGTVQIKVQNKNLFDESKFLLINGWTKNSDGYYTGNSGQLYNYFIKSNPIISNFKENTRYTFSYYEYVSNANVRTRLHIYYTDNSEQDDTHISPTTSTKRTVVTQANKTISYIRFDYGNNGTIYFKDFQIEEGSTATTYVAHAEQTVNFPLSEGQYLAEGGYLADDGIHNKYRKITLDGSEDWRYSSASPSYFFLPGGDFDHVGSSSALCSNYINRALADGNYSFITGNAYFILIRDDRYNETTAFKSYLTNNNVTLQYELATESITPYTQEQQQAWEQIKAMTLYDGVTHVSFSGNIDGKLKLQYNVVLPSPSPEVPSTVNVVTGTKTITISNEDDSQSQVKTVRLGSLELAKIGDYQDCIFKNTPNSIYYDNTLVEGAWYKRGNIRKTTINSANGGYNSGNNWFYYGLSSANKVKTGNDIYSNFFKYYALNTFSGDTTIDGISVLADGSNLLLRNTNLTTENEYKTWFNNNSTVVCYVLNTPTISQITDTNLIDDLEDLRTSLTYANETNITQSENELPFWLEVKAEVEA